MGASDTLLTVGILALGGGALYYLIQSGALSGLTQGLGQGVGFPQTEERQEVVDEAMGDIFGGDVDGGIESGAGGDISLEGDMIEGGADFEDEGEDEGDGDKKSKKSKKSKKKKSKKSKKSKDRDRDSDRDNDFDQQTFPNYQQSRQQYPSYQKQQQQYQQEPYQYHQQQPQYPYQQYPQQQQYQQTARPPAPGLVSSRYQYPTPPEQQVSLTKTTYSPYSPYNQFYQYYQYQQYPQGFLLPDDNVFFTDITRDGGRNYTDPRYRSSRSCIDCTSECAMNPYSYGCQVCRPQCKRAGTTPYQSKFVLGPAQPQGAFLATIWNTLTDGFQDMDAYKERKDKFDCHNKLLRRVPRERYNKKMVENADYQYDRSDIKFAIQ